MTTKKREQRKKQMTRLVCLALAGVMVLSTMIAALLSQVW